MEYSVKEVINKINNEWFLPAIQRPYVWGGRYEEEKYICRLFDSVLRGYPIGLIILWKPGKLMPFRRFLDSYADDNSFKPQDEEHFQLGSSLVYDGQQRLQSLYSCLKFSFKNRKLMFDLSYERKEEEECQDTGFHFINESEQTTEKSAFDVAISRVYNLKDDDAKIDLRDVYKSKTNDREKQKLIEKNLDNLYTVFSNIKTKSPSLFVAVVNGVDDNEVNEVFQRLNMGGVQLSNADLLFSRIKETHPLFESEIIDFTKKLSESDSVSISAYDVLQVINIIVKGQTKINPEFKKGKAGNIEREQFVQCWKELQTPLMDTIVRYLSEHMNINRLQIIPRKMPLLSLIVYMYYLYKSNGDFVIQQRQNEWLRRIDKFFITAELNDWSLQSYSDAFAKIFRDNVDKKNFPLEVIFEWVRKKNNRYVDVSETTFCDYRWFALKVVFPEIRYSFKSEMTKRFNPELDHIFPIHLSGNDEEYRKTVDVVWNMQPVVGDINIDKLNYHPYEYFMGKVKGHEYGKNYFKYYEDSVPQLSDPLWQDYKGFVEWRKKRFIELMKERYGISIQCDLSKSKTDEID